MNDSDNHRLTRRSFLQGTLMAGAALGVQLPLTSCNRGTAEGVGLTTLYTTDADEYFTSHVAGTRQACEALGCAYSGFTNENQPEAMLSQYETAASRGAQLITVVPPNDSPIPATAQFANAQQIPTYFLGESPPWYFPYTEGRYAVAYSAPNDFRSYYDVSRVLLDAIGGQGQVLMLTGFPGGTADRLRTAGARRALSEYPDVRLLGSLPGEWNREDGQVAMEDLMTRYPDFDAVLALNDDMAVGALAAIRASGREGTLIVGHNGTSQIMELIKSGSVLATAATFPFWQGAYAVARAYDAMNGYEFSPPETMMLSGHEVISSENVDVYVRKYVDRIDSLPLDFKLMSRVEHPDDWDPQNLLYPIAPEEYWRGISMPDDFAYPASWQQAHDDGTFDRIKAEFEDAYQRKLLAA